MQLVRIGLLALGLIPAAASAQTSPSSLPPADLWKPFQFLMGTWDAKTQGGSAAAASSGRYSFQLELRGHVLARHSLNSECKGPTDFNCDHGDLLYIYPNGPAGLKQTYRSIYFDNEGHVIHYEVSFPEPSTLVLLSAPTQGEPQFRLSYELKGSVMTGKFQMRMPGQAEFKSYLEWSGAKT